VPPKTLKIERNRL